ncbi:MAG: hypothetical protein EBU06_02645 [Micrococcales bacterium]|nr:hypothetical protein [Micrococcales bacterium]
MSFPQSVEYQFEQAVSEIFSEIDNLNVYTTNRTGQRLLPYILVSSKISRQLINQYSGVYEIEATLNYSDSCAKVSDTQFDEKYLEVFSSLYSPEDTLTAKIGKNTTDLKIYMARISEQIPTIIQNKRAWLRGLKITAIVTPDEFSDGYRSYIFSDFLNSFYLSTI